MGMKEMLENRLSIETDQEKRDKLEQQIKDLALREGKEGRAGAVPRDPKQLLLDARDVSAMPVNKDRRIRWINVGSAERAEVRKHDGYQILAEKEGGRRVGNLALAYLPKKEYERRVAVVKRANKERLDAHKREMEQMAESVAKTLRDQHGLEIDAADIIVQE